MPPRKKRKLGSDSDDSIIQNEKSNWDKSIDRCKLEKLLDGNFGGWESYNELLLRALDSGKITIEEYDVSFKSKENVTTIKAYLWTVVSDIALRSRFRDFSMCASQLFHRATIISNLIFQDVSENLDSVDDSFVLSMFGSFTKDVSKFWRTVVLPEKFDRKDWHGSLSNVMDAHASAMASMLPPWEHIMTRDGWHNACEYMAKRVWTNAKLHITRHLLGRAQCRVWRMCSNGRLAKRAVVIGLSKCPELSTDDVAIVREMRRRLGFEDDGYIHDVKLTASTLRLHLELAKGFNVVGADGKSFTIEDRFSVMPRARFQRKFVRIDRKMATGMIDMAMRRVQRDGTSADPTDQALVRAFGSTKKTAFDIALHLDPLEWRKRRRRVRNIISKKKGRGRKERVGIGHLPKGSRVTSIETDGVAISLTIERDGKHRCWTSPHGDSNWERAAVKIGIDPGRASLVTTVEKRCNRRVVHFARRGEYYGKSLVFQNRRWCRARPQFVEDAATELSEAGGWKNADQDTWRQCIASFVSRISERRIEYIYNDDYARWRMAMWRKKRSYLSKKVNAILEHARRNRQDVVIGYGSAGVAPTGKGELAMPTTGITKAFIRAFRDIRALGCRAKMEMIDEFNTTKCCHRCGHEMKRTWKMRWNSEESQRWIPERRRMLGLTWVENRRIRSCHFCERENEPVRRNRDLNAALNILAALEAKLDGRPRPEHLRRSSTNPSKVKVSKKRRSDTEIARDESPRPERGSE
jgi:hypothetical protein